MSAMEGLNAMEKKKSQNVSHGNNNIFIYINIIWINYRVEPVWQVVNTYQG